MSVADGEKCSSNRSYPPTVARKLTALKYGAFVVVGVLVSGCAGVWAARPALVASGTVRLETLTAVSKSFSLQVVQKGTASRRVLATVAKPLEVELVEENGKAVWLSGAYSAAKVTHGTLVCEGKLNTPNGTTFRFNDAFKPTLPSGAFKLTRTVQVRNPSSRDRGFSTRFLLSTRPVSSNGTENRVKMLRPLHRAGRARRS